MLTPMTQPTTPPSRPTRRVLEPRVDVRQDTVQVVLDFGDLREVRLDIKRDVDGNVVMVDLDYSRRPGKKMADDPTVKVRRDGVIIADLPQRAP
jgi:hypothetical protein